MCQPSLGVDAYPDGSDFSDFAGAAFGSVASNSGLDGDGAQMAMPDGTLMLMPNNPSGALSGTGDYNADHDNDFSGQ